MQKRKREREYDVFRLDYNNHNCSKTVSRMYHIIYIHAYIDKRNKNFKFLYIILLFQT